MQRHRRKGRVSFSGFRRVAGGLEGRVGLPFGARETGNGGPPATQFRTAVSPSICVSHTTFLRHVFK